MKFTIGTLRVDALTLKEAIDMIVSLARSGRGAAVYTPNVDHVVMAETDVDLRRAYEAATLCLADGAPLVWASRWSPHPLPEKVSGSDLVEPLLERASREGLSVYFLGGAAGVAECAARRMSDRYPALRICGVDAPEVGSGLSDRETRVAVSRVQAASPNLLLVGLGCPKQELFIHRYRRELSPAVALGVGATFSFLAGAVKRAPRWMSRVGLEWLYRLIQEPRLWRRYLIRDPRFVGVVIRSLRVARALERVHSAPGRPSSGRGSYS
ncbi:MAG: WecB/TagA/CpsF family glycosyltransferase [Deltaproteobacteria bacterium]|nr:WecB/TagA/CpsF family glycosyltransferase [Deltaproteobacteria bacterium]